MSSFTDARDAVVAELVEHDAVRRLYAGDHTLWRDDPTELADRLGWIPVVQEVLDDLPALAARCEVLVDGIDDVLLMGMGGSSLFPEVLARTLEPGPGCPRLHVLDTTDPAAIARIAEACAPARTLHLAASKSGTTIETRSHLEWAWERAAGAGRFAAITDPTSELAQLARSRGFAEVFENREDIGGRYSALSLFGVVPGLLMGVDVAVLLQGGVDALARSGPDVESIGNPALLTAATIAAGIRTGHDKATFALDPALAAMGLWVEQLVAESLGKDGTGAVPIVGEPLGAPDVYGGDRLFLAQVPIDALEAAGHPALVGGSDASLHGIGHMVVTMELAVALVGAAIGVQPFDQPDVAAAKAATNEVLAEGSIGVAETPLADLLAQVHAGDHIALQVFADPGDHEADVLEAVRVALRDRHRVAVSLGFGPRFLHSTGQLHKGGPKAIVCVQAVGDDPAEIAIPGQPYGFGHLKQAQAAGDLRTLQARGIRAGRVHLHELLEVAAMKLGMVGLGRMGGNMAQRLRDHGHEVVGYDVFSDATDVATLEDLVAALPTPRLVWVMVPAGDPTEDTVNSLASLLAKADVVIDGGNSNWHDSVRRAAVLGASGIGFIDAGTSGGVWGLTEGYCLMVGGDHEAVAFAQPVFDALAPDGGFVHTGPVGTGHFTKMVHNGVEYGLMQAYAEGYELLARSGLDIDATGALGAWRQGSVVRSWLLDLLVRALEQRPGLHGLAPVAQDSGEGRWTVQEAVERGVATPVISAALYARFVSQDRDGLAMRAIAALREQFGGHAVLPEDAPGDAGPPVAPPDPAAT